MAKLRINGDSSGYVDLSAPNASSSRTIDVDQLPELNVANTFSADMSFGDNNKVNLGAGNDLQLYHDGYNNYIKSAASGWLNVPLSGNGMTVADGNFSNIFFKIDSSGRVTKPKQPAFEVNITTNTSVPTSTTKINFNNINVNTGNHYDGTNDRFVAPVSGKYFISWCVNAYSGNVESRYIAARLYKNGVSHRTAHGQMAAASGSSDYGLAPASIVVHLNVNDYLEVYVDAAVSGLTMSANNTNFTGFLIG